MSAHPPCSPSAASDPFDAMTVVPSSMRWASRAQFFCSGFVFATWGVHIPTVKAHYGVNEAELGLVLLAAGFGALLGLTQASRWIGRYGAGRMAGLCGSAYALLLAGLLMAPGYAALLALLVAFGIATSVFDVAHQHRSGTARTGRQQAVDEQHAGRRRCNPVAWSARRPAVQPSRLECPPSTI